MQAAVYAGVPAANTAVGHVANLLRELDRPSPPMPLASVSHPGTGVPSKTASLPVLRYTVREARNGLAPRHAVVLSHALGCDLSQWDQLATALASDCRVICYDHRGQGESDVPAGPYCMEDLAQDGARLVREIAPAGAAASASIIWVGLSMGAMVGQEIALRHPGLLKALVSANAGALYDDAGQQAWAARIAAVEQHGLAAIADGVMERWFTAAYRQAQPAAVARWRHRLVSTHALGYVASCRAVMKHDTLERLSALQLPVLLIAGSEDKATPPDMSEAMARRMPHAQFRILEGAAHLSVLEQPDAFFELLRTFLQRI